MKRFLQLLKFLISQCQKEVHSDFEPTLRYEKYHPNVLGNELDEYTRRNL